LAAGTRDDFGAQFLLDDAQRQTATAGGQAHDGIRRGGLDRRHDRLGQRQVHQRALRVVAVPDLDHDQLVELRALPVRRLVVDHVPALRLHVLDHTLRLLPPVDAEHQTQIQCVARATAGITLVAVLARVGGGDAVEVEAGQFKTLEQ
jgi:hypothetical protein